MSSQIPNKVITFGCRLNIYESQVMQDLMAKEGLGNTILINTCAVTAEAERQALQSIRKAKRENPTAKIIVTGCAAQINPEKFAAMPEVDRVLGNQEKMKETSFLAEIPQKVLVNDIMSIKETATHLVKSFDGKTRAFMEIQNGCNHRCTFCIIPYGRGNSRSVPLGALVDQTRLLVDQGYQEIILTGVDITAYGEDLPGTPTLGKMIRRLLTNVPQLKRLRLSSLDPVEVDEDLFQAFVDFPQLVPHVHISLQAGDDLILKRMKRRHLRQDIINFCDKMRTLRPDMVFGADVIAGFPTETEDQFQNTYDLLKDQKISYLHVFPYSPRPGTPAARMPQVEKATIKNRAAQLRALGKENLHHLFQQLQGQVCEILIERDHTGRTEHFAPVKPDQTLEPGSLAKVEIIGIDGNFLCGKVLST
ncbi:MAG: tRNA (N(6)-L-threonylcarbamoyladenosine(37)-C(2))-methylthiotransferase MtaB [Alphaproteobacteria bacterium]